MMRLILRWCDILSGKQPNLSKGNNKHNQYVLSHCLLLTFLINLPVNSWFFNYEALPWLLQKPYLWGTCGTLWSLDRVVFCTWTGVSRGSVVEYEICIQKAKVVSGNQHGTCSAVVTPKHRDTLKVLCHNGLQPAEMKVFENENGENCSTVLIRG